MELSTSIVWAGVMITIIGAYSRRQSIRNYIESNIPKSWINILGYTGGFMQLGAVTAVSMGWLNNTSPLYHGISLVGSGGPTGIVGSISNLEVLEDLPSLDLGLPTPSTA